MLLSSPKAAGLFPDATLALWFRFVCMPQFLRMFRVWDRCEMVTGWWDLDGDCWQEWDETRHIFERSWDKLTDTQQEAAKDLGYTQKKWDK